MGFDFNKLSRRQALPAITEPGRIFTGLPKKQMKHLRGAQAEVLDGWHERKGDSDLVLKMNTGAGKTAAGLLVLQSALNEGKGPALFATPDKNLRKQAEAEADKLGLRYVSTYPDDEFEAGRAILITHIDVVVNGLSRFGTRHSTRDRIRIGSIVFDDAHACLAKIREQFTITVRREHPLYGQLRDLFAEAIQHQNPNALADLRDGDGGVLVEIPFYEWADKIDATRALLHEYRQDEDARMQFAWPLLKDDIEWCEAVISSHQIQISLPCLPIDVIPSVADAARKVFMTATLNDDSILVSALGADPASVARTILPSSDDLGDRLILAPARVISSVSDERIRDICAMYAKDWNVVVLVPSSVQADVWKSRSALIVDTNTIDATVEKLRAGHVGLVVMVNRYDGIDLPKTACHLLVLDGTPGGRNNFDQLDARRLDGSDRLLARNVQRIEQGMGRAVRSNDDHCAVVLIGSMLARNVTKVESRSLFTPSTRAQLDLAQDVWDMMDGHGEDGLIGAINQSLGQDEGWHAACREAMAHADPVEPSTVPEWVVLERRAFDEARGGETAKAAATMRAAAESVEDDRRLRGLLLQRSARYQHCDDKTGAQETLLEAKKLNRELVRPRAGLQYERIREVPEGQAARCAAYLAATYSHPTDLVLGVEALFDQMAWHDKGESEAFEDAVEKLGLHLGFGSQRPDHQFNVGPDNLWYLGNSGNFVIEVKSRVLGKNLISKGDAEQLVSSTLWFDEDRYPGSERTEVMIHPREQLAKEAQLNPGTRILTPELMQELRKAVVEFVRSLGTDFGDAAVVEPRLRDHDLIPERLVERYTLAFTKSG